MKQPWIRWAVLVLLAFAQRGVIAAQPVPGPVTVSGFYLDLNKEPWVFQSQITQAFEPTARLEQQFKNSFLNLHRVQAYTDSKWLPEKIQTWATRRLIKNQALSLSALNLKTGEVKWIKVTFVSTGPQVTFDGIKWQHLLDHNSAPYILGVVGFQVLWLRKSEPTLVYQFDLKGAIHHANPKEPLPPPTPLSPSLSTSQGLSNSQALSKSPPGGVKNMEVISSAGTLSGSGRLYEAKLELVNKTNQELTVYVTYEKKIGDAYKWLGPVQYRLRRHQKTLLLDASGPVMARKANFWAIGEAEQNQRAPIWPDYRDKVMDLAPIEGYPGMARVVTYSFEGKGTQ